MVSTVRRFAVPVVRRRFGVTTTSEAAGSAGLLVIGTSTDTAGVAHWYAATTTATPAPEGQTNDGTVEGSTDIVDLRAADDLERLPADVLVLNGSTYEVTAVTPICSGPDGTPTWVTFRARSTASRAANP
jgi:hypothetical protein